jgi:membrane fusion protein (multidrug efflux system)
MESMPMKKLLLILLAGALALQVGCGRGGGGNGNGDQEEVMVPVEIGLVTIGDIGSYFTGTATLEAEDETEVVAKVGGVVKALFIEEGDYVTAGQVLAKLDDEKISVQMEQATANLRKLENEFQRSQELYDENLISLQEFQRVKYEYEHQKATYDLARLDLEYTSIRAPISGVVAERLIKVGNMVLPNQAVFQVTDLDPLLAVLHVPERQIGKLRVGHVAALKVDALDNAEFSGRVERISPVVDPGTGTVKVTIEARDEMRRLKPGMFARVHIVHDVHENAVLVPRDAVIEEDNESSVFVVRDSIAVRQIVETGFVNSVHIEVTSGLGDGDTVVTTGKGSLKDSTRVEVVSPRGAEVAQKVDGPDSAAGESGDTETGAAGDGTVGDTGTAEAAEAVSDPESDASDDESSDN